MNPRFSIIVSAYNVEDYIERAIESVLQQTFKNYELIVVNDASTDNTGDLISKYKNIVYIKHEENRCLGRSKEHRFECCKR